jgi:fumarate reductase flavoprotein subunit
MELAIIVGNNSKLSYNLKLAKYMQARYSEPLSINLATVNDLPMFNVDSFKDGSIAEEVSLFHDKLASADGLIIATPEYNYSIPASLKNALEWMSTAYYPFKNKPVMIVGCALGTLGTVRAQMNLRTILNAPGLEANIMPGNEFLLTYAQNQFNENNELIDKETIKYLDQCFLAFIKFIAQNKKV